MTNSEAQALSKCFLETGNPQAFNELWRRTVHMASPYKFFDPTGARTEEDFLQITKIALVKALQSFDPERGSTLLSWIKTLMRQGLIREVRRIKRSNRLGYKISWDAPQALGTRTLEEQIYKQLAASDSYQPVPIQWSEQLYWTIVADVERRIKYDILVSKCYSAKLVFPNLSRTLLAEALGVSRSALSKYFNIIRDSIALASRKYSTI